MAPSAREAASATPAAAISGGLDDAAFEAAHPLPAAEATNPQGPASIPAVNPAAGEAKSPRFRGNLLTRAAAAQGAIEDLEHPDVQAPAAGEAENPNTQKTTMRRSKAMHDGGTQETEVKASLPAALSAAHTSAESFGNSLLLDVGKEPKHEGAAGTAKEEVGDDDTQKTEAAVLIIRPLQPGPGSAAHQLWVFSRFYVFLVIAAALAISLWQNTFSLLCKGFEQLTGLDSVRPELDPL